jgi:hypothetical protein
VGLVCGTRSLSLEHVEVESWYLLLACCQSLPLEIDLERRRLKGTELVLDATISCWIVDDEKQAGHYSSMSDRTGTGTAMGTTTGTERRFGGGRW